MRRIQLYPLLPAVALLLTTGCTDDNYDLDSLDKTVGVSVNNLVVPVNLGAITLNSVIDLDNDDPDANQPIVKETVTDPTSPYFGKEIYVFQKSGDFDSDEIHISTFNVNPPVVESTVTQARKNYGNSAAAAFRAPATTIVYDIDPRPRDFTYHVDEVDDKVKTVEYIEAEKITLSIVMDMSPSFLSDVSNVELRDLVIKFPEDLRMKDGSPAVADLGGKYDPATGELYVRDYSTEHMPITLTLTCQQLNLEKFGQAKLVDGEFRAVGHVDVQSGQMILTPKNVADLDEQFDIFLEYEIPGFEITDFTGEIDYDIDGLDFDAVDLTDLPDFLADEATKIRLANPQLYLSIYNTCAQYRLGGNVGLELKANHQGGAIDYEMPSRIKVNFNDGVGPYRFAISPEGSGLKNPYYEENNPNLDFRNAEKLEFKGLQNVLYGNETQGYGIPSTIDVDFLTPAVEGVATRFPLKTKTNPGIIPPVHGDYLFRAPLALYNDSQIIYTGDKDDWDSKDLQALEVNLLEVTAKAYSDIPVEVELTANLLSLPSASGLRHNIGKCMTKQTLKPMANGQEFTIIITPEEADEWMTGIDGIRYNAVASVPEGEYQKPEEAPILTPDMSIRLEDLRIKVNGRYVKDLDD